jgi:hypothetical protein
LRIKTWNRFVGYYTIPCHQEAVQREMIPAEMLRAVEQFMLKVTIPILYHTSQGLDHIATGTLFETCDRYFLVTARHAFENPKVKNFTIPTDPKVSNFKRLGRHILYWPEDEAMDIAVLEILETSTIDVIKKGWRLLNPEQHSAVASPQGTFLLCGYPSEWVKIVGQRFRGTQLIAYTTRLKEVPKNAVSPIDERMDLFFRHTTSGQDLRPRNADQPIRGGHAPTPPPNKLAGTSGSSVWEYYQLASQSLWSPDVALRIIGIQHSVRKGQYIRVKSWGFVMALLGRILHSPDSIMHVVGRPKSGNSPKIV